jgi:DNA recombination protein RmuC
MPAALVLVAAITTLVALVGVAIVAAALRRLARDVHREARGERAAGAGELDAKKALIDQSLAQVARRIAEFERTMREIDGQRREQYGALAASVRSLSRTTQELHEALASARVRGQWGERMAEDVLRVAGFVEGVNYRKQKAIANGTIPDFTFLLPNDLALHMDVKFPLDNYMRYVRAANDIEREQHRRAFLRDVRERVKELTGRGYLDDRAHTVECLLLFVPNEGLFAFVQEHDPALLDDALARGIVVCSPLTLFAILRVIRQAIDHFRLERTASEILTLLGEFEGQWAKYNEKLEKVQRSFQTAQRDLDELATTRTRQLQRPLDRIAALRRDHDASGELDLTTGPAAVGAPRRLR